MKYASVSFVSGGLRADDDVLVGIAVYAGGVIDGIDGLAGGVFAVMFTSYGMIALSSENHLEMVDSRQSFSVLKKSRTSITPTSVMPLD